MSSSTPGDPLQPPSDEEILKNVRMLQEQERERKRLADEKEAAQRKAKLDAVIRSLNEQLLHADPENEDAEVSVTIFRYSLLQHEKDRLRDLYAPRFEVHIRDDYNFDREKPGVHISIDRAGRKRG